jgi:hypothetical protein
MVPRLKGQHAIPSTYPPKIGFEEYLLYTVVHAVWDRRDLLVCEELKSVCNSQRRSTVYGASY